jgi:hypothetical protein
MRLPVKKEQPVQPVQQEQINNASIQTQQVQPVQQVQPTQVSQQNALIEFWNQTPSEESIPQFSIEQIHSVLPVLFSYLLQNPQFMMTLLTSPQSISNMLLTQSFRPILVQLMNQSSSIISALRTGTNANVVIGTPNQLQQNNVDDEESSDETEDEEEHNDLQFNNPINVQNMLQTVITPQIQSTTPSATESEDIQQLMALTGMPLEMIKQVYDQCGKNVDMTATILFNIMEN